VEIDGRRVDCVAESEIIESGSRVRVQRVMGMKVIVAKV
jgi:membrane protein implicated in regulation of membrane protease activity